jgi:catalase
MFGYTDFDNIDARRKFMKPIVRYFSVGALVFIAQSSLPAAQPTADLAKQIVDIMSQAPGVAPGYRVVHAKGIVGQGTFQASAGAATISRAAHFKSGTVPVTVRFSDGASDPSIPDASPDANPRGIAIRFMSGRGTDIVAISHNGFLVGSPEDFLALVKAKAATDPSKPHPWPIEAFLGSHPAALKFVQDPEPLPVSLATESFFANNAFRFVDAKGKKVTGRYQIVPLGDPQHLDDAAAKTKGPDFLFGEIKTRLAQGPVKFRLLVQVADAGDRTDDSSIVWPQSRKKIEMGIISITSLVADSAAAERDLAFDPARIADGIELSDDPLPALRSMAYALAVARRRAQR